MDPIKAFQDKVKVYTRSRQDTGQGTRRDSTHIFLNRATREICSA